MIDENDFNIKGWALVGSGFAIAFFWLLAIPFESFAGPEIPLHQLYAPSQTFHVLGSALAVFGYVGIYLWQYKEAGTFGKLAFPVKAQCSKNKLLLVEPYQFDPDSII